MFIKSVFNNHEINLTRSILGMIIENQDLPREESLANAAI